MLEDVVEVLALGLASVIGGVGAQIDPVGLHPHDDALVEVRTHSVGSTPIWPAPLASRPREGLPAAKPA